MKAPIRSEKYQQKNHLMNAIQASRVEIFGILTKKDKFYEFFSFLLKHTKRTQIFMSYARASRVLK